MYSLRSYESKVTYSQENSLQTLFELKNISHISLILGKRMKNSQNIYQRIFLLPARKYPCIPDFRKTCIFTSQQFTNIPWFVFIPIETLHSKIEISWISLVGENRLTRNTGVVFVSVSTPFAESASRSFCDRFFVSSRRFPTSYATC